MRYLFALTTLIIMLVTACASPTPSPSMTSKSTLSSTPMIQSVTSTAIQKQSTSTATPTSSFLPSATPEVKTERINFTTQDNITLAGTLFGDGEPIVILAHMGMPGVDQQSWQPFARLLATKGYTALTFDFRGRGESSGILEYNKLPYDMDAAMQYLNDHGYTRIVCIGASMGGTACMRAALDHDLVGLGVIASALSNEKPNEVSLSEVQQLDLPKILVYGVSDFPVVVIDMKKLVEFAPEPKMVQVYQTNAHGTDLFNTQYGSHFTELLIDFLEAVRSSSPLPTP